MCKRENHPRPAGNDEIEEYGRSPREDPISGDCSPEFPGLSDVELCYPEQTPMKVPKRRDQGTSPELLFNRIMDRELQ